MKRLLSAMVLILVLASLCVIPVAVSATSPGIGSTTVTTLPATNITPFSATLNASVMLPEYFTGISRGITPVNDNSGTSFPNGYHTTTAYFRYGTSPTSLISTTLTTAIPFYPGTYPFTAGIVGLLPCTTYYAQAFVVIPNLIDYQPGPSGLMTALLSSNMRGLGIGLSRLPGYTVQIPYETSTIAGNIVSFTTPGCSTPTVQHGTGAMGFNGGTAGISNITVQTAAISSTRVGPGDKVDITATVANKGTVNGATRVTLYINGQEVESKGITLASGQSEPVHFFVTQNDPGTYSVQVGGVSAGSFTVDAFNNNDILIYGIIALFTLGIAGTLFMLTRKRPV